MKEIRGDTKNLRSLLGGTKFAIDYYQREYRWETKQVAELIEDLAQKFRDSHESSNDRSAVEQYGHYFLGSIIVSDKDGQKFIIDGQQRLTTLTLLLVHIYRHLQDDKQRAQLSDLIFSQRFGKRSFNIDVEERNACMEALFAGTSFDETGQSESVANILHRHQDVEELFPEDLATEALPYFSDWLIENVHLVEITAYSDADAYTIFETMNDRGLSLTPTDMLKGYLLANITDADSRNSASHLWRKRVTSLQDLGKEEDADAIKAWLRSRHAVTIRERRRGAEPRDFDLIGTEFHRWVRDHEQVPLGLSSSTEFARFIKEDFAFYSDWYTRLRQAAETLTDGLESIHFCAQNNFTLQYPVLLASLRRKDDEREILRKLRVVSAYLDILITRRIWNWRAIDYSTMQYAIFVIVREIRDKKMPALVKLLGDRLAVEKETFVSNDRFRLHGTNKRQIGRLLARITDYVETRSGRPSHYHEYVQRRGKNRFEIEHVWADHTERHGEFEHPADFAEYRNRIGGLLLLPKSFNASYGDMPYADKRKHYLKQNLLAQSLHEDAYERDPGFTEFVQKSGLPFKPHPEFRKADLDARQDLYRHLAEQIWNPERLAKEAES